MKHKKKILSLLIVVLIFHFPEEIFSNLAGVFIILLILFLLVEILLDVYIVIVFLYHEYKDKKEK
jgi:hypothetical protein